ncbi:MAG: Phosphatidylserine decarboxylase [Lactobacillus helveticus]|jgi:phosphatidylserine decarboxylase|uniref:Phosphatidylserine decarboxylase proenzyme n=2 Tax=Lactobacillus helveticus TaxID=1587 RepID=A0A9Q5C106_LACHE|nr:Phosphatidylserine decarboxylase proenzyme [Lactobacillus helveticus]NRN83547.1 Phosphatidylserine decarboxylase proenzyme [Lactobacillus helveticus]NRN91314.1 Phosphatidylserine decarboxylase proenzyme [Lactobacillus helveticus]NRN96303.1 Phosphatidylserine decarboxylase proenzyme [Lactobacillus helveticus]NRO02552.1 Phosphatidylserine decarboxylase proenzyme [Lactobacillus helveticus]
MGKKVYEEAKSEENKNLLPPLQALKELIESDRYIWNLFQMMFDEIPQKDVDTPAGTPQVRDYHELLLVLNRLIQRAPEFNTTGLVGTSINAVLDYPMGTRAGYVLFNDPRVNAKMKGILDYWGRYLQSEDSSYVLNTSDKGWLSSYALNEMAKAADGDNFLDLFAVRSTDVKQKLGYTSWDDFFTRKFKAGIRPIASPDDDDVIANACESAPFRIAHDVPLKAKFWIKGQPYSLINLLHNDPWTSKFEGGTLYQAFLSALSYHRWNSPVSGKIVKAYNLDGTYYGEALAQGFENPNGPDKVAANNSQAFLTSTATRAVIFIQADNPKIGLMCFVAVGMGDVSNNEITVRIGQHVNKGDQLGMFHFGGSTHVLLFRPEVKLDFDMHGQTPGLDTTNIKVREAIAHVE